MATNFRTEGKLSTAVITGGEPYDVVAFQSMLRAMTEIDFYPQHIDDFVTDGLSGSLRLRNGRSRYDVVVFYNWGLATPSQDQGESGTAVRESIERLGEGGQGIVMLHHALTAYPEWQLWSDICGNRGRGEIPSQLDQALRIEIASPNHPITSGLTSWEMVDETYEMPDVGHGNEVLLTIDHSNSMGTVAWTRQHKSARVFCCTLGHGYTAYSNSSFRTTLSRGIHWVGRKI